MDIYPSPTEPGWGGGGICTLPGAEAKCGACPWVWGCHSFENKRVSSKEVEDVFGRAV